MAEPIEMLFGVVTRLGPRNHTLDRVISNFEWLMTLTLTLDQVKLHTVVHQSSTSTYMPNFIEIKEMFC